MFTTHEIIDRLKVLWHKLEDEGAYVSANTVQLSLAHIEELTHELESYQEAVRIDAQMDGPKFMGCNVSQLRRAYEITRIRAALTEMSSAKEGSNTLGEK